MHVWKQLCICLSFPLSSCRLHEFDEQVSAVREGMARVVPVPLLSLFTGYELETMVRESSSRLWRHICPQVVCRFYSAFVSSQVCGSPDIPLHLLKSVATYKGVEPTAPLIQWFWDVMESFSNTERSLFLRFVWGRTRLPRTIADFRGRDFVVQVRNLKAVPWFFFTLFVSEMIDSASPTTCINVVLYTVIVNWRVTVTCSQAATNLTHVHMQRWTFMFNVVLEIVSLFFFFFSTTTFSRLKNQQKHLSPWFKYIK